MASTPTSLRPAGSVLRRRLTVTGVVQGVGFRPFVHVLATRFGLAGHVANGPSGVLVEVEGSAGSVEGFCHRLESDAPPLAEITTVTAEDVPAVGGTGFVIRPSAPGRGRTLVPPDIATCDACLAEFAAPADRRYRHPFITCTHCGPRYTITTGLPYDRATTSMSPFPMCAPCADEYTDPADRRFHAQPIACWSCGPRLRLTCPPDAPLEAEAALSEARRLLAAGAILAVKGIGGYHLVCDAADRSAVGELRRRKARGDKPFAVMAADVATASRLGRLGPAERALLTGPARPIVLLRRHRVAALLLAEAVCPGSPDVGVMLPYTPLHRLLFGLPGDIPGPGALVVTSGNRSGEPLVTDDQEALRRLDGLADAWLGHDREIVVACDDSVVRARADGTLMPVRRSRGFAPARIDLPVRVRPVLAVGGDLKNTLCLAEGRSAWLSAHIGDMDDLAAQAAFERAERHLRTLTGVRPEWLAADRHPAYRSAQWAGRHAGGRPLVTVQHHHAHIAAVMAENGLDGSAPVIGVAFDGTGYGDDGAIWGGEVLLADYRGYRRVAHLAYVPLPGGDAAVRNPYRTALSHLRAAGLDWTPDVPSTAACRPHELGLLARQLDRGLACPSTSSMGRLFDAVSSLAGICHRSRYEAQAAVELEAAAVDAGPQRGGYAFELRRTPERLMLLDPAPVIRAAVADVRAGADAALIAACFHVAVSDAVRAACRAARTDTRIGTVALSGGVFGNALLDELCTAGLAEDGFTVLRHTLVPPGDGGLALGQAVVAAHID
ncbi:carbamoyltransferase HypF [Streptomyces sannanensis]|uniref:Carbamoyltransferase n=1 Tax=Streptomyces sannanensis TaxID=285536 RepID=A0ABP6SKZ4_9ACTN